MFVTIILNHHDVNNKVHGNEYDDHSDLERS